MGKHLVFALYCPGTSGVASNPSDGWPWRYEEGNSSSCRIRVWPWTAEEESQPILLHKLYVAVLDACAAGLSSQHFSVVSVRVSLAK